MTAGDVSAAHFCLNYIIHNFFMCRTLKHGCCHVLPWLTEISSVVPSCFMLEVLLIQSEGSFIPLVRNLTIGLQAMLVVIIIPVLTRLRNYDI